MLVQQRQLQVIRSEVMPPLGHAVGLVNGEQRNVHTPQQGQRALLGQAFRGDVQQVQLAPVQGLFHLADLGRAQGGIEVTRVYAQLAQGVHLVLHQRDQGRNDHPATRAREGGNLVAQGFAAAGGHQDQGVAAPDQGVDDLVLGWAEGLVTKGIAKNFQGVVHGRAVYLNGHAWRPSY